MQALRLGAMQEEDDHDAVSNVVPEDTALPETSQVTDGKISDRHRRQT